MLHFRCARRDFYQRLRGTDRRSAGVASRVGETAWRTRNGVVGRSLRQALYLCGALSLVGIAILPSPVPLLRWTEVPPALRVEVGNYLAVLALALPPAFLFRIYSTLNQASGLPQVGHVVAGGLAVHQSATVHLVYFFSERGCPRRVWWAAPGPRWWSIAACSHWPPGCCAPRTSMSHFVSGGGWSLQTGPRLQVCTAGHTRRTCRYGGSHVLHADGAIHRATRHHGLGRSPDCIQSGSVVVHGAAVIGNRHQRARQLLAGRIRPCTCPRYDLYRF